VGWHQEKHSLAHTILVNKHPLPTSSIYYDPHHPPYSIYVLDNPFPHPLSRSSLVYLLVWNPPLHTPHISSPNHYLPFPTHAHTITTSFAVVPKLNEKAAEIAKSF